MQKSPHVNGRWRLRDRASWPACTGQCQGLVAPWILAAAAALNLTPELCVEAVHCHKPLTSRIACGLPIFQVDVSHLSFGSACTAHSFVPR